MQLSTCNYNYIINYHHLEGRCPAKYVEWTTTCHKFISTRKTFEGAKQHCKAEGGHLVDIATKEEELAVKSIRYITSCH